MKIKSINWVTDSRDSRYVWINGFPFFDTEIDTWPSVLISFPRTKFSSLSEAKDFIINALGKSCESILKVNSFEQIRSIPFIDLEYSKWCDNAGRGKYIHNSEWAKYHWLFGTFIRTSYPANNRGIRFPISISEEEVKNIGVKILKRHAKRFLKLTQVKTEK